MNGQITVAIKIYLNRDQRDKYIQSTEEERNSDSSICAVNTKAWTKNPLADEALGQDLSLWIDLGKYETIHRKISVAAKKALESHSWHLSDKAVGLALFSDQLPVTDKVNIVHRVTAKRGERKVMRVDAAVLKERACLGDFATL